MSSKTENSSKPIKLALLLCDTPTPAVRDAYGTYLDIFRKQLHESNPDASFPFTLDGFDVVNAQEYPNLDAGYAGVLISGSAASAHESKPWINKLVAWVYDVAEQRPDIKLIGICFGHQIIARALGGECVLNDGKWEIGTIDIDLTEVGKAVFQTAKSTIPIQQMHRDHVPYVPPGFLLLGSSPVAPVQGLIRLYQTSPPSATSVPSSSATSRLETVLDAAAAAAAEPGRIHIFTVQGHPEFTGEIVNAIIDAREHSGVMSADAVRQGRERAFRNHEGIGAIGRAIWRVLGVNAPPAPA